MKLYKQIPDDAYTPGEVQGIKLKGCLQLAIPVIVFWVVVICLIRAL